MNATPIAAVILAAGQGTRMRSAKPKVLHEVGGRTLLAHVLAAAKTLGPQRMAVVIGDQAEVGAAARAFDPGVAVAVQAPPKGTGDAVAKAMPELDGFDGLVVILYADTPLIGADALAALAGAAASRGAVLGFRPKDAGAYGRIIAGPDATVVRIVEARDASQDERRIGLCNSGVMAAPAAFLREALPKLAPNNAKREYYLTDIVAIAAASGRPFAVAEADEREVMGVNSRAELAAAEAIFQQRARIAAMNAGATLADPSTVYFSFDTRLGRDVAIEPHVVFGPGVAVADGATIKAFSHIEGASIGEGVVVGPFARLRPGAVLEARARVGNFVEVKESTIGEGAKVNHLTYVGDATVGARANIGAGTITCNYDGYAKHVTEIGEDAFIGSNTALVAPVKIGRGAYVGSGSVITKPVEDGALAVARGRQAEIRGWAARFRKSHGDGGHE
jgi:bifunctional UDP-N-acetylglucosamine pyrophosphorylase/glucosamine-1-phosphate N-acetyltransferase